MKERCRREEQGERKEGSSRWRFEAELQSRRRDEEESERHTTNQRENTDEVPRELKKKKRLKTGNGYTVISQERMADWQKSMKGMYRSIISGPEQKAHSRAGREPGW